MCWDPNAQVVCCMFAQVAPWDRCQLWRRQQNSGGQQEWRPWQKGFETRLSFIWLMWLLHLCRWSWPKMPEDLQTRWESSFSRLPPRTTSTWKRCSGPSPPWSSSRRRTRRRDWTIPQKSTSPKVDMGGRIKRQTPKASAASKGKTIIDNFCHDKSDLVIPSAKYSLKIGFCSNYL